MEQKEPTHPAAQGAVRQANARLTKWEYICIEDALQRKQKRTFQDDTKGGISLNGPRG